MDTPPQDLPLDHILRFEPPWRTSRHLTECGRPTTDVASVITREQMKTKLAKQGKQRAAFTSCMTCLERGNYASSWESNPSDVLDRDRRGFNADLLKTELQALTLLWEHHQEEFREAMEGLGQVAELRPRRRRSGGATGAPIDPIRFR